MVLALLFNVGEYELSKVKLKKKLAIVFYF